MLVYTDKDFNIDELGSSYTSDETVFKVFAPRCKKVYLILNNNKYEMFKNNFTFELSLKGDFHLCKYYFENENNESFKDPFAYYSDDKYSYVLDKNKFNKQIIVPSKCDAPVIYEVNVRDFSSSDSYIGDYKKKFLALAQDNLKVYDYFMVGLDYIKNIGVSHIQLMPVFSYDYDNSQYNWGYNPLAYNYVHADYVYENNNPYAYINELRSVINKIHEKDIRVNLDVVFNHVYKIEKFDLYKTIGDNCFRYTDDGKLANGTLCGNELRSEDPFVRAYIIKMIERYIELFDIDGLRFDLMGILDYETINQVFKKCKELKEDFYIYGEGWNMGDSLDESLRASINNAKHIPNIKMFNDYYRDTIIKYLCGNDQIRDDVKNVIQGNNNYFSFEQSINYVECHDNYTLYDRLSLLNKEDKNTNNIKRCKLAMFIIMMSKGLPFIHMGQEFIRSKNNIDNSYNSPDSINGIDWNSRIVFNDICDYLMGLIQIRKQYFGFNNSDILFKDYYDCLIYTINDLTIIINPSRWDYVYDDGNKYDVIYDINGKQLGINNVINIPAYSGVVLRKIF